MYINEKNTEFLENLKRVKEKSKKEKIQGLNAIIADVNFLIGCWYKIKSNKGGIIPGKNQESLDGLDIDWFRKTSESIKKSTYKFEFTRKKSILKKSGKKRDLSNFNPRDKIVLEGIRFLLSHIFEDDFSDSSHGFRPNRGCHTCLNYVKIKFGFISWLIKGDILSQFDNINQEILINKISQKVDDKAFIDLLWKAIRTQTKKTKKGISQGSPLSPLLSNIYIDIFDKKVEELQKEFKKGNRRRENPIYTKIVRNRKRIIKKKESRKLDLLKIYSKDPIDPNFKRLSYARYGDDFILGLIGSKKDAEFIKNQLTDILQKELKLNINTEKTQITHSKKGAKFLGYIIKLPQQKSQPIKKKMHKGEIKLVRSTLRPNLNAPINEVALKLREKGYARGNKYSSAHPTRCGRLIYLKDYDIIQHYLQLERGILNYYKISTNYGRFSARVHFILKYSCALTLGAKHRLNTLKKVFNEYGFNLNKVKDKRGRSISYPKPDYTKPSLKKYWKIQIEENPLESLNSLAYRIPRGNTELKGACTLCGSIENIEIHHLKAIKKAKSKDFLTQIIQKINRKQVPLCKTCHIKVHQGKHDGPSLKKNPKKK